jgi:RHS repeat-associated protein
MRTRAKRRWDFFRWVLSAFLLTIALAGAYAQGLGPGGEGPKRVRPPVPPWAFEEGIAPLTAADGVTALSGRVVTSEGVALAHVAVRDGAANTTTDDQGRFLLTDVSAGTSVMVIDARQAGPAGQTDYGYYEVQVTAVDGITTLLPFKSWLPRIDHAHEVTIASPTTAEVVVTHPGLANFEFHIPAGAIITGPDHKPVTKVSITPIPLDRTPFPLPNNVDVPIYFTVQPGGATITGVDGKWLGAQVWYPNIERQLPGARASFWRYDPYGLGWTVYGIGTVSADGRHFVPGPDTRVYDFTSAMINGSYTPPASGPPPCGDDSSGGGSGSGTPDTNDCSGGDPVDYASGLWVHAHLDLSLQDVIPLLMSRTYRQGDTNVRSFGVGMTLNYEIYLWSAQQYQQVDLITAAGGRVHYVRTSSGTGFTDAVFTSTAAPGPFFNSTIVWNGNGWTLVRPDGLTYVFGENAPVQYLQDRYGNRITFTRSGAINQPITTIRSSNGRSINLTYTNGVITKAVDNIGRTVTYTYDSSKRLQTATDPNGGITTYAWDTTNNRIISVQRPRQYPSGPVFVTNTYDPNGRVQRQTFVDGSMWQFAYTLDANGNVTEADATDPNGNLRKVTFNSSGYWLTDKRAFGTAQEQDFTAVRGGVTPPAACPGNTSANSPNNYLIVLTDALGRLSCWTYDFAGHVLTATRLAGTANQVTTTYAYGAFEQFTQITDPLGHTITIGRDSLGRPTSITDGLGNIWPIVANPDGTIASMTDPLSHTTTFAYDRGDLVRITDPLGRVTTRYGDGVGRLVRIMDALNALSQRSYDPLWGIHLGTDANGNTVTTNYNLDGLVSSVLDPRSTVGNPIQTQYAYDTKDRRTTRTDPLSHADTITSYDGNDNVLTAADRKGQAVTYTYDALNRITGATYADGHAVAYTWDNGNRLTQVQDTVGGVSNTIARSYDGLDRLTQEQVVQGGTAIGTVGYNYDAASRRASMTVSGQSPVSYTWDNANRLTQIAQGTATIAIGYDTASRRTSLTLPNGIVATYSYDAASELTQISYDLGGSNVGVLTYGYDNAGRVASRGGTLFQSVLPAAVTSASYDADNRLTQWASVSPTYDLNGNLTNDGSNSYAWDARDRLTGITGVASFVYDGVSRRQSFTQGSTTLTSVYDGLDPVQEQSGGAVLANLLTGLGIDERFTRTEASTTSTFLTDGLQSTVALASASGAVQTSYGYDSYGNVTSSGATSDNPYQFTGRQNDGTGLYYYRARYYNPTWARFISEDPTRPKGTVNLYAYGEGNPLSKTDPKGLQAAPPIPVGPWLPFPIPPVAIPGTRENDWWTQGVLSLFKDRHRGSADDDPERCKKVLKQCHQQCLDIFAEDPENLPGCGSDHFGRFRRCVRECAQAHGCYDY